jgi:hypothetical protein
VAAPRRRPVLAALDGKAADQFVPQVFRLDDVVHDQF